MNNESNDKNDELIPQPEKRLKLDVSQSKKLRKFKEIPIFIVDYHNEVLEFIYRCFASRYLPFEGNTLIHFDSHPDMVISREIKASTVYNKDELLSQLSIENWIMPACYAGHFQNLIWMKNSWCDQIPVGKHTFKIGNHDNIIHVNLQVDYFISEGNYCDERYLKNSREIILQVIDSDNNVIIPTDIIQCNEDNLILDIDLDFFSTSNPFLNIYEEADCYNKLKEIFSYGTNQSHEETCTNRKLQLNYLNDIFNYLEENRNLDDFNINNSIIPDDVFQKISQFVDVICDCYDDDDIDWNLIKDAGLTCDHNGLPHHISTDDELKVYFKNFEDFLKKLPHSPVVITISRSSEDDYCPRDQVDLIQKEILSILDRVFENQITKNPILAYTGENWDLIKL